jgi:hypothetical protein
VEAKVDCKCYLLSGLKHGYLNSELLILSSKGVADNSGNILKELIKATKTRHN